jgi:hypothetical protein
MMIPAVNISVPWRHAMDLITDRYAEKICSIFECYDRIVIQGTLPGLCHADGMTGYLYSKKIRIFDYPRFAEPFRDEIRDNASDWRLKTTCK